MGLNRRRREHLAALGSARLELGAVERRQREIMEAVIHGYRSEAWKEELIQLDDRKAALTAALAEPPIPALHPDMAETFRRKATTLAAGLEHDEYRDAARQVLRGSIEKIIIPPGGYCRSWGTSGRCWKPPRRECRPNKLSV